MLQESSHFFLIKRNLRRESFLYRLDIAKAVGEEASFVTREGKTVYTWGYTGKGPASDPSLAKHREIVFQFTERIIDKHGNLLHIFNDPETVIGLYYSHGTSEQFHFERKSDMNFEPLSSGKMTVNEVLLSLAMVAYNTLRLIGQTALSYTEELPYEHSVSRKRLRKVIDDLIRVGCKPE